MGVRAGVTGAIALFAAALLSGCVTPASSSRLDVFSLGTNLAGETCLASRNWNDPAVGDGFDRAYLITCQGVVASRPLGTLRAVKPSAQAVAAIESNAECGAPLAIEQGGEQATAAKCQDRLLNLQTVQIAFDRGGIRYVGSGVPSLTAQVEEGLAIMSGQRLANLDVTRVVTSNLSLGALELPMLDAGAQGLAIEESALNPATSLNQGISLNHKGQYIAASRLLNDAISRLTPETAAPLRAELLLEAGLADSNIKFPDAARVHFDGADEVFQTSPAALTPFLIRKRDTYRALDALNRHAFSEALERLDRVAAPIADSTQPLRDAATLRLLNQSQVSRSDISSAIALPKAGELSELVLDAEAQYTRSVALLSLDRIDAAEQAIAAAAGDLRPLTNERIDQSQLLWLNARIDRQRGRLFARRGEFGSALDAFDRAIDAMRRGSLANAGTGSEPAIAEATLERAAIYARSGASRGAVIANFASAVDDLLASGSLSPGASIGMEDYLDLLVAEIARSPTPENEERYFRAVQASGEPAIARQLTQLRSVVSADPAIAQLIRDRTNLERELTRLRYALAADAEDIGATKSELESARSTAQNRLIEIDTRLAANGRYRTVDDAPATIADLRQALAPDEGFLKLTALNRRVYGLYLTRDRMFAYHVADSNAAAQAVDALADRVRASIDGDLVDGRLVAFDEAAAYALYRLVSGPAYEAIAQDTAIIVDPAGPLERLPFGVLVARYDPAGVAQDAFDFSQVAFAAKQLTVSTALSPRSFLVTRALPGSRAAQPLLGLGEHRQPAGGVSAQRKIQVGFACNVEYQRLADLSRSLAPIDSRELGIAATALGQMGAPTITEAQFSDTGILARSDLDQYEVLHFATHGLEEGVWGCDQSPPALVTSFGDETSDGLLSFSEIADLKLDANLVVLSACDTGSGVRNKGLARASGQEEAGATLEGLVRAFLTANARAVLATHWQVSAEQESDQFIAAFYRNARTQTMAGALRTAQQELLALPEYSHPFYWAPYFIVGDGSKTMLTDPSAAQVALR